MTKALLYLLLFFSTVTLVYISAHEPKDWLMGQTDYWGDFWVAYGDSCEKKKDPSSGILLCGNGRGAMLVGYKVINEHGNQTFWLYSYDIYPYRVKLSDIGTDGQIYDEAVVRIKPHTIIVVKFDGPKDSYLVARILPHYR